MQHSAWGCFMEPAEGVVEGWLNSQGYFVMANLKDGRKETDFLAVKLAPNDKNAVAARLHVEVTVGAAPWGGRRPKEVYLQEVRKYVQDKFENVRGFVEGTLGGGYSRWFIHGKAAGGEEEVQVWREEMSVLGVRYIRFDEVVKDYVRSMRARPGGETGQMLYMLSKLGLLKTEEN